MSWERMSKVIDRYERLCKSQIRDLKQLQKIVLEKSSQDNTYIREQIKLLEDHLLNGLLKLFSMRNELEEHSHEQFDQRMEPIRSQVQATVAINKSLPPLRPTTNSSIDGGETENPYEFESKRYAQQSLSEMREMEFRLKEAKEKADATAKIQKDMQALEDIMTELQTLVYQQNEMVDSIEEHVERANHDVHRGNNQLKRAVQHKAAKAPMVAAVVGGIAIGGPVGIAAGSTLAGITAAVGGIFAGIYGGKWLKKSASE